jgi:WD40 repeat protein
MKENIIFPIIGVGMVSMAGMGGILGLGVYGLAKMFSSSTNPEPIAETFNRMEDRITYEITGHTSAVLSVAISPDGNTIVSGSLDTVKLWDLASGNLLQTI